MTKSTLNGRQKARRIALQALYSWALSGNALNSMVEDVFHACESEDDPHPEFFQGFDKGYLNRLLNKLPEHLTEIEAEMTPFLSRPISSVNPVELAILRIAFYELIFCHDVPYKVVINEAIDLAKGFGADQSHRFINGVLDKAAKVLRER